MQSASQLRDSTYVVSRATNKTTLDTALSGDCEVGHTTLELSILNNITETSKHIHTHVFHVVVKYRQYYTRIITLMKFPS